MKNQGPNPNDKYPLKGLHLEHIDAKRTCFLKNVITRHNVIVGDFTYFDDPIDPEAFETRNILYHFPFSQDRLIIKKFCAIASGVKFIMNGGSHKLDGFSTYPFMLFQKGWDEGFDFKKFPFKGNTTVGNDVWIGYGAIIMPGITIGDGAIIGSGALVTKNVEPYAIVGGNPAKVIRKRFDENTIKDLIEIKWWDWSIEKITKYHNILMNSDINELKKAASEKS